MTDEGVVINGVRWATRNADGFRTFVASPEMLGGFYAWQTNRSRDRYTLRIRNNTRNPDWNPCPPGWRLPTDMEFLSLIEAESVWTTVNGVYGRLFGTVPHQLFLPAGGKFLDEYPEVRYVGELGFYWFSHTAWRRWRMIFCQKNIGIFAPREVVSQTPRRVFVSQWETVPFAREIVLIPELSVRCVAITAD